VSDLKPSLLDRSLRLVRPRPVSSFKPPPRELAQGLWRIERRLAMPGGLTMPTHMTIVRLSSGGLLLHSPVELDDDTRRMIRALGEVEACLAPNSFHYLFLAAYAAEFPAAAVFLAPHLPERVSTLPRGPVLTDAPPPQWGGAIDQLVFGPVGSFTEVVLFHRPTATLVLTDLGFHMPAIDGLYNRLAWRLFGVPGRFGPSRTARLTLLRDRALASPYLKRIDAWDFRRILVAHGEPVERDAKAEFRRAYASYLA
jgi:uncharacterized protein DUF4336